MRAILLIGVLWFPLTGWAQIIMMGGSSGVNGRESTIAGSGRVVGGPGLVLGQRSQSVGSVDAGLRTDLGTGGPPGSISFTYTGRSKLDVTYFTRTFTDSVNREIFGYELLLEQQQQPGSYLATFSKTSMTPATAADVGKDWRDWSVRDVQLPAPKVVHEGDVLVVELMTDATTGFRLADYITIRASAPPGPMTGAAGPVFTGSMPLTARGATPTVSGPAREFSAEDAEMRIMQPRITLNGDLQRNALGPVVNGSLVWLYLPGHGRYILSLAPRLGLRFRPAGEVRGGVAKFTVGGDTVSVECPQAIATGHAAYTLYVMTDAQWEPTSSRQKGELAMGSVDVEELEKLEVQ